MREIPTLRVGFQEYRLVEGPDPQLAGALVARGEGSLKKSNSWLGHCYEAQIPFISARLMKRYAVIETNPDPKSQGGAMTEEADQKAWDALSAAGASGVVGSFTHAKVPLSSVTALIPKLVAIFNAPGAIVTGDEQCLKFLGQTKEPLADDASLGGAV